MGLVQRLVQLLPRRWSESIEAESRQWMLECPCGHAVSVWDAGGVRWKAKGNPSRLADCPKCGPTMHRLVKRATA